ncbi:glycoside hydrolase family 18 protein [Mycena rebaudengoi]|nr:glycoside hydrolase family 18 protein [Mycena rebaudengoi]
MCRRLLSILRISLLFAPALVSAAQYCSLTPPSGTGPSFGVQKGSATNSDASDVIASAWYPGWVGTDPTTLSWNKYNAMTFAFATTTPDSSKIALDDMSVGLLPSFVAEAKSNGVSALLSIGGWTGSIHFSTAVATQENRTAFVNAVLGLVSKYKLDGIDFDWEYPGKEGLPCNKVDPADSANFLAFLQQLRGTSDGQDLVLTAAVGITPFVGSDGAPMNDVSEFAKVLDRIALMAYDVWGPWSTTVGPNAPLDDACAPTADRAGSAASAVKAWTNAGFPADQIVLGVAAYGHSFHVTPSSAINSTGALSSYPNFSAPPQPEVTSGNTSLDPCGQPSGDADSDIFTFEGLVSGGFLGSDGFPAEGIDYRFDSCSQTPYVYNHTSQVMVSYDDAASFAAKGRFINDQGLLGFAVWDATGDKGDILLSSLHEAIGIETDCQ